jgi:hypothetical protein
MVRKILGLVGFIGLTMSSSAFAAFAAVPVTVTVTVRNALITEIYCGYIEGREMCSVLFCLISHYCRRMKIRVVSAVPIECYLK